MKSWLLFCLVWQKRKVRERERDYFPKLTIFIPSHMKGKEEEKISCIYHINNFIICIFSKSNATVINYFTTFLQYVNEANSY